MAATAVVETTATSLEENRQLFVIVDLCGNRLSVMGGE